MRQFDIKRKYLFATIFAVIICLVLVIFLIYKSNNNRKKTTQVEQKVENKTIVTPTIKPEITNTPKPTVKILIQQPTSIPTPTPTLQITNSGSLDSLNKQVVDLQNRIDTLEHPSPTALPPPTATPTPPAPTYTPQPPTPTPSPR